jgi:hypothetical protein
MIDNAKPPDITRGRIHYLLFTPFRYPPLLHGSRFGTRFERGIWYGSRELRSAFAEVAYYRLLFIEGSTADLGTITTALTAFVATVRTMRGVNLVAAPFDKHRSRIASPTRYDITQQLGTDMRAAGVEAFEYPSARDREGGINVGVFAPSVFGKARPRRLETWHSSASRSHVDITQGDYFNRQRFSFARTSFLAGGVLPSPAV